MSQLFLHLAREKICLQGTGFSEELAYVDIERQLPILLTSMIKKYAISSVWVLNGPGSFTTLRLGCLTLQTIKQFGSIEGLKLFSCSKLDLYSYAHEQGLLPDTGYVFIGQKKNMWCCKRLDSKSSSGGANEMSDVRISGKHVHAGRECSILHYEKIPQDTSGTYFIDPCEHILVEKLNREYIMNLSFDGKQLHLTYHGSSIPVSVEALGLEEVKILEPEYLIEPQIG